MEEVFVEAFELYASKIVPWVVLGSGLAWVVERWVSKERVRRYLRGKGFLKTAGIMAMGMVSPLSILSFLPVAGELVGMGASPGLLLAFFIAERAYDLQSIVIISQLFGAKVAIANAVAIYVALLMMAGLMKEGGEEVREKQKSREQSFWRRQVRLWVMVVVGIGVGAGLRVLVPEEAFRAYAGSGWGGVVVALVLGLVLYLGPVLSNYPVARALADVGMSHLGVMVFLTVSPVVNMVVIWLLSAMVGVRETVKPVLVYGGVGLVMAVLLGMVVG